ncbi:MAG: ferredoxin-thioredoxin reductase catalytic domain-containing protein [Promethearchaeota archaeon]|jgi:ferredoxin-thioredoxin reductase catalytic subunit
MTTKEGMEEYVNQVAQKNKWILNKDELTFNDLIDGLVDNKNTHGYQSCPCRLASGKRDLDRDLICPCDYAPPDIEEYGACYCNLYLNLNFYERDVNFIAVPERRPIEKEKQAVE